MESRVLEHIWSGFVLLVVSANEGVFGSVFSRHNHFRHGSISETACMVPTKPLSAVVGLAGAVTFLRSS